MNERYIRQTMIPGIGEAGQEKLKNAKVLIVGIGGLGSPISLYLTAAGVGQIGLIDDDIVSKSNLQRQILYTEAEIGQSKVECACRRLSALNSSTRFETYPNRFTPRQCKSTCLRLRYHCRRMRQCCDPLSDRRCLFPLQKALCIWVHFGISGTGFRL